MSKIGFFFHTALNNLRRGGQRAWVALLCIAFGVMSLIAMSMLSKSIERALILEPVERMGADASLSRQEQDFILPEQVDELEKLRQDGLVQQFTLIAASPDLLFRGPQGGVYHSVSSGLGIDPTVYPLAGKFEIREPGNIGLVSLLNEIGDVIITADIADTNQLRVGDSLVLTTLEAGAPVVGHIRGIASDTPNHQGSKIYFTLQTAARLTPARPAANTALLLSNRLPEFEQRLNDSGWSVFSSSVLDDGNRSTQELFDLLLKGAGILGLMVGGIGIANTMQVLLRRRQTEIAIWKTIGCTERDLQVMFVTEAALLGSLGSLLGAALGIAISYQLVNIFSHTGNLLVRWEVTPSLPLIISSLLVGVFTTVVFALWAIVGASRVQPLTLLRSEPTGAIHQNWKQNLILALLMGLPFAAVTSLILGSPIKGLGVLLFALAGLMVLGGLLSGAAWVTARLVALILPLHRIPLAQMTQQSLRRHSRSLVFAMIALFTGVITLTLGVVVTGNAQQVMSRNEVDLQGYNIALIAPATEESAVRQAFEQANINGASIGTQTSVRSIRTVGQAQADVGNPVLVGRDANLSDYQIKDGVWDSSSEGVYVYWDSEVANGAQIEVTSWDGSTRTFTVAGRYNVGFENSTLPPKIGLLLPVELSRSISAPDTLIVYAQAKGRSAQVSTALGQALPNATVIDLVAYATRFTDAYHNLFILALAMSSLALLAGVLLVANSVSLAMLDRRYEIGILKSIGYSRAHVQGMLAAEYGQVALISAGLALAVVAVFLAVMGQLNPLAARLLVMPPLSAALLLVGCTLLIIVTVLAVTWQATHVSPTTVLNDRG